MILVEEIMVITKFPNSEQSYKGKSLMLENWINSGIIFINDIIDDQGNISEVVHDSTKSYM
jgi:hypothetical protein